MAVELAAIVRGELFGSSGDRHDGDPRPAKYDPPRWLQAEGRVRRCRRSSTTFPHRASRKCLPSHATRRACSSTAEAHAPPIIVSSLTFPRCSSPATSSSSTTPASSRRGCGCAETRAATSRCSSYARWKGADGTPSCGRRGASTSARCCDRCIPRATSSRSRSVNALDDTGGRRVRLLADDPLAALDRHGTMPLPPYIHTPLHDPERYQTVYASRPGSVGRSDRRSSPHAGPLAALPGQAHRRLHGRARRRSGHVPARRRGSPRRSHHPSRGVPRAARRPSTRARLPSASSPSARRRCAALESAALGPLSGDTSLFIHGGFDWQVVDLLMTNFHLPRSSLLLLVDAFVGPRWRGLYDLAMGEGYRFLSFGDAMLLDRHAAR